MGLFKTRDPVTGAVYSNAAWRRQREQRELYAIFYVYGVSSLPEWPGNDDYGRSLVAVFLALWASESYVQVQAEMPPLLDALFDMHAGDIFLLVQDIPLDERSVDLPLPEPNALKAGIRKVPPGEETRERHEWRLDLRARVLRADIGEFRTGIGTAAQHAYAAQFSVEVEREITARYCGKPGCRFCENPFPDSPDDQGV